MFATVLLSGALAFGEPLLAQAESEEEFEDFGSGADDGFDDFGAESDDGFEDFGAQSDDGFDDFGAESGDDFGDGSGGDDGFDDFGADGGFDDFGDVPAEGGDEAPILIDGASATGFFKDSEVLAAQLADQLTVVVNQKLSDLSQYEQLDPAPIAENFEMQGPELADECATDAVCMGRVGANMGADYVIVGRVEQGIEAGTWTTTLNLIDTDNRSIDNFVTFVTDARTVSVQNELDLQVNRLLRIRTERETSEFQRETGKAQGIIGWTALGLGVAAIGVGTYFAIDFANQKSELEDCDYIPGLEEPTTGSPVCTFTQLEARQEIADMRPTRNLSLAMTGAGAGLVVTGAVLLLINSGNDIYDERGDGTGSVAQRRSFRVSPTFARDHVGVQSLFEF